jgi:hypothetical protein
LAKTEASKTPDTDSFFISGSALTMSLLLP